MRIACVDNISAAAYRLVRPPFRVTWQSGPPASTAEALRAGLCDAALVPAAELVYLGHVACPAGPFGIAAFGPVRSVLYLGQRAPQELIRRGEGVHISPQSRTARALFPLLCRLSYGRSARVTSAVASASARILIGNDALAVSRALPRFRVTVDLAEWWLRETGLPMVFAQWMVRRGLPASQKRSLQAWLEQTTEPAGTPEGRAVMAREVAALGRSYEFAVEYYRGIRYRLGDDDHAGLAAFLNLLDMEAVPWAAND